MGAPLIAEASGREDAEAVRRRDHGDSRIPGDRSEFDATSYFDHERAFKSVGEPAREPDAPGAGRDHHVELIHTRLGEGVGPVKQTRTNKRS